MFGDKIKADVNDSLMINFFNKMNTYGKFWMNNHSQTWSISFDMYLANGSKLEIRCDDKKTPNEAVDGLIEKMKSMEITLEGVKFEDFIK